MKKISLVALMIFLLLIVVLYIPSVEVKTYVHYDESHWAYGRKTYWKPLDYAGGGVFYGISEDGDVYIHYGNGEKYYLMRPGFLWEPRAFYLSDSVVYEGNCEGRMFYGNLESGRVLWTMDLSRLHIYFNATNDPNTFYGYRILWGNTRGYFYIYFNHTLYYLYKDIEILGKWHFDFKGWLSSSHYWNGGLVLLFEDNSGKWGGEGTLYSVYYVKNGTILWNLTFLSPFHKEWYDVPGVYIYEGYVYYFEMDTFTVYENGRYVGKYHVDGDIVNIKRIGDLSYVVSYEGLKNLLYVFDANFNLLKRVELFDMEGMGIHKYVTMHQRADIYLNRAGYTIFLYTYGMYDRPEEYVPLRIITMDSGMNITGRLVVPKIKEPERMYPLDGVNRFILVSDGTDLYFVSVERKVEINPFAFMYLKMPIFLAAVFICLLPAYIYLISREVAIRRDMPPGKL